MLRWRLAGAALIILPTLVLLWLDDQYNLGRPGIWIIPLGLVVGWNAARELGGLICDDPKVKFEAPLYVSIAILILSAPVLRLWDVANCKLGFWGWTSVALAAVAGCATFVEMRRFERGKHLATRLSANLFIVAFVAVPLAFMLGLRLISPDRIGILLMASVIFVVKWSDAGAYFVGRFFGRTPLAPVLSPKKTWEGLAGGMLFAVVAAITFDWTILPSFVDGAEPRSAGWLVMYSLTLAGAGLLGDLSISLLKRDAEQKDSGQMLPGLGGCLDVIDSMLWAGPLGYLWWIS